MSRRFVFPVCFPLWLQHQMKCYNSRNAVLNLLIVQHWEVLDQQANTFQLQQPIAHNPHNNVMRFCPYFFLACGLREAFFLNIYVETFFSEYCDEEFTRDTHTHTHTHTHTLILNTHTHNSMVQKQTIGRTQEQWTIRPIKRPMNLTIERTVE